jgi:hypothetical protein
MRKVLLAGLVAAGLVVTAGSAVATESPSGSSEGAERTYACPGGPEDPAPGPEDCQDGATEYTAYDYDNEVDCGSGQAADTPALAGNLGGDPAAMEGYGEICSDDDNVAPIQGRILVDGSQADGINVSVDGDASNPAPGDGWVSVHVGSAPSVSCGDAEGNLDSQTPTDADTQEDCG